MDAFGRMDGHVFNEFHLRVDAKALKDIDLLKDILVKRCESYLLSYEIPVDNPDNPHYQGYIRTLYKDITIRKDLTKVLSLKGNQAYSLSALRKTKEELLQYCCKDGNVVITTFTQEEVEIFKSIGSSRKEELVKKKAKVKGSIFIRLKDYLKDENTEDRQNIAYLVMKWHRENNVPLPNINRLQDLVRALWAAIVPEESFEKWAKSVSQQFFSSPEIIF